MGQLESIEVNSKKKADRILELMWEDGRRGWYEPFYDYDGVFYVIYYRTKEVI